MVFRYGVDFGKVFDSIGVAQTLAEELDTYLSGAVTKDGGIIEFSGAVYMSNVLVGATRAALCNVKLPDKVEFAAADFMMDDYAKSVVTRILEGPVTTAIAMWYDVVKKAKKSPSLLSNMKALFADELRERGTSPEEIGYNFGNDPVFNVMKRYDALFMNERQ